MSPDSHSPEGVPVHITSSSTWMRRLIISLTILVWIALAVAIIWIVGHVLDALLLLAIGALVAYAIYPLVQFLQRLMPRPLAVGIVYLVVLGAFFVLLYFVFKTVIAQLTSLILYVQNLISSPQNSQLQPILQALNSFGITTAQLQSFGEQIILQLEGVVGNVIPFVSNVFSLYINAILVITLSIYFLGSGPSMTAWLRNKTPLKQRGNINFVLNTAGHVLGGYIRGTAILAAVISILTGIGLNIIGVPYAFLLAVFAFVLEFIPVIGIYITAVAIILLALTKGVLTGALALGIDVVLQTIETNILSPRIIGQSIGLNPIVIIFAVIAGAELYGIVGAFFAAPVAGVLQVLIVAYWKYWRTSHAQDFTKEMPSPEEKTEEQRVDSKESIG